MFDLEDAILKWRRQLAASDALSLEALDELESHLRDELEQQHRSGLDDQDAFNVALQKLGRANVLQTEFTESTTNDRKRLLFFQIAFSRTLSNPRIFRSALKSTGILVLFWCVWMVLGTSGIVSLTGNLPIQIVIWSLCAAYGLTVLAALFSNRKATLFAPLDDLTVAACQSLGAAREQAFAFNHDFVGTEHLLLGLVGAGNQSVTGALKKYGIDEEGLRREIQTIVGLGPANQPTREEQAIPYTPRALNALLLAHREAKALNHSTVDPEHMLLGLLAESGGVAGLVLRKLGADTKAIRKDLFSR